MVRKAIKVALNILINHRVHLCALELGFYLFVSLFNFLSFFGMFYFWTKLYIMFVSDHRSDSTDTSNRIPWQSSCLSAGSPELEREGTEDSTQTRLLTQSLRGVDLN